MLVLVAVSSTSGCAPSAFACSTDAQCDGPGAACEPEGWCSFPADDCPSGRRYGKHSGDGLGGVCVPGEETESTNASTSASSSASTNAEPPTASSVDSDASTLPVSDTNDPPEPTSTCVPDETSSASDSTGAREEVPPVAWYTFDDPRDPFADASGNGLHAWCDSVDCPEWTEGIVGEGAIRTDGLDDHLHVDQVPALAITEELTVAVWARLDVAPQSNAFLSVFAKPVGTGTLNSWQLGIEANQLCAGGGNSIEQRGACVPDDEIVGVWHHIALTWNAEQLVLYVDGDARETNETVWLEYDDLWVMIGADVNNFADAGFFPGAIDDARIYDQVLDEDAIRALFEMGN